MASEKNTSDPAGPSAGEAANAEGGEALTQLLREARAGDAGASDRAYGLIYRRLHEAARHQLRRRAGRSALLTPTVLVNEAWLKLASAHFELRDREHYVALASQAMRQIVVDMARAASSEKRGGEAVHVTLTDAEAGPREASVLRLDEALQRLELVDARLAQVVLYRYFGGLSEVEVAGLLGVTDRTVRRDWRKARAFLHRELQDPA